MGCPCGADAGLQTRVVAVVSGAPSQHVFLTTSCSFWWPTTAPSAFTTRSNVYVPAGVPDGTWIETVIACVVGVGTGPSVGAETHAGAAGAGLADATSMVRLATG